MVKSINKPVECTNCIHSKMNGFELICTEFQFVIADNEPLCSAFEPKESECEVDEYSRISTLTERELNICSLLTKGFISYEQLADKLCVTISTMKTHINNINQKLQVHSIKELIYYLIKKDSNYYTHINKKLEEKIKELEEIKKQNIYIKSKYRDIKEELETQKQTNKDCEAEYRRVVTQYNAVVEQNRQLQAELSEIKNDIEARTICVTCDRENENDKLRVECEQLKERATIAEDNFAKEIQARLYHQTEWQKFSKCLDEVKEFLIEIYGTSENDTYISQSYKLITKINEAQNG